MKNREEFINSVNALVTNLNQKAEEARSFDPLRDISFQFSVEHSKSGNPRVTITASYLSGGGEESSYVINDEVTFLLGVNRIENIVFSREFDEQEEPPLPADPEGYTKLIKKIETFFVRIIPSDLV